MLNSPSNTLLCLVKFMVDQGMAYLISIVTLPDGGFLLLILGNVCVASRVNHQF